MSEENHDSWVSGSGCCAGGAGTCIPGLAVLGLPDGNLRIEIIKYVAYKKHVLTETARKF